VTLERKVAVVTGGGSGLGEAIALRLGRAGARVAVLDVDGDAARLTAALAGGIPVSCDVSVSASVDAAAAEVEERLGAIDLWVNNAGIAAAAQVRRIGAVAEQQLTEAAAGRVETPLDALVRLPDEEWRTMLAVHLDGTFYGTRAAARSMASRGGVIVNIASVCGIDGCVGYPHYSAAKAGVIGFTRAVAKELAVRGIRVNAIAPGYFDNVMRDATETHADPEKQRQVIEFTPMARRGRAEELIGPVVFLASDASSYVTGAVLFVDGGYTAM